MLNKIKLVLNTYFNDFILKISLVRGKIFMVKFLYNFI